MENVATSVRINAAANALLSDLAVKTGRSKAQVIEEALAALEERLFWTSVQEAFAEGESPEMRAERELWDRTVGDGLKGVPW
ncbi:MAG: hypothetical protein U0Q16_38210 [Bryobacteraceae bacterium]